MSTTTSRFSSAVGLRLGAAALLAVAVAGCAAGGGPTLQAVPPATNAATPLGALDRASGAPVKVGWLGIGLNGTTSDATAAAVAVAGYANAYLGGLAGRPIEMVTCEDEGTPEGARRCGEQFVREGVVATALGSSGQFDSALQVVGPAGIPVVANLVGTQTALQAPGVFVLRNPLSTFGTPAAYARDRKLASAVALVVDVAAASPARTFVPAFFANAGSAATVVMVPQAVSDMTPQVRAAGDPQMWLILGDPPFCAAAITAIREVGGSAPITALDNCVGRDVGATIPGGYEGVDIIAQAVLSPDDPEYALFSAVLATYGEGVGVGSNTVSGYQGMLGMVRAVNAARPREVTAASVAEAMRTAPATPYPLGGGATFRCDGQAVPGLSPNICTSTGFIARAEVDGTMRDFRLVDADGIYRLG